MPRKKARPAAKQKQAKMKRRIEARRRGAAKPARRVGVIVHDETPKVGLLALLFNAMRDRGEKG